MQFSPEVLAKALKNIYKGFDVKKKIEENIFWETLRLFNEAAAKGFSESEWNDTPDEFINQVRTNNKVWSAFRTHRMQNDLASKLLDENGQLKKFDKWVEDIKGMTNHYVGSWLRTEYNTAVIRAHQAADWKHFEQEADVFPNLRWMPTTSLLQDPKHRQYWEAKLTLPINHPFWEDHHPGDRWNCKCTLKQTDEPVNDYVIKDFYPVAPQAGLDNNPGVDAKLFNDTHPYFKSDCKVCPFYGNKISNVFKNKRRNCNLCSGLKKQMPQKRHKSEDEKTIIKTLWEARRNMNANTIAVAQKLGVNRPLKRRTFNETCNSEANPLFSTGKPIWGENCQCSVVAYELRRRGFNVHAMPNKWKEGSIPTILAKKTTIAWLSPITNNPPIIKRSRQVIRYKDKNGKIISEEVNIDSLTNDLNLFTKDVGRYHLTYYPLKGNYAHIVTAERFKDDKLEIFDPQSGILLLWEELAHSMNLNKGIRVYRVDNLFVNTNYVNGIVLKD